MKYNVRKLTVVEAWEDKDRFYEALEDALDETGDAACWPTLQPYRALVVHETAEEAYVAYSMGQVLAEMVRIDLEFIVEAEVGGWENEDLDRFAREITEVTEYLRRLKRAYVTPPLRGIAEEQ